MKSIRRFLDRVPRPLRFAVDLALVLAMLLTWYVAAGCPALGGETAEFRWAEKAGMVGPSEILGWVPVLFNWPYVGYDRILVADDGDVILFYTYVTQRYSSDRGTLYRHEKTDGLLLTTLPAVGPVLSSVEHLAVPLFLFVDEPAALRAEVDLLLPSGRTETLTATRGILSAEEGEVGSYAEAKFFLFQLDVTSANHDTAESLMYCGAKSVDLGGEHPAVIRLYDAEGRLLCERDFVIRTRNHG